MTQKAWDDDVEEILEEHRLAEGNPMPEIEELLKDAEEIDKELSKPLKGKQKVSKVRGKNTKLPVLGETFPSSSDTNEDTEVTPTGILPEHESSSGPSRNDVDYQESFTSQQETAEIRGEMQSLDNRLMNIEAIVNSVVAERDGMQQHLDRLKEDVNKQFTVLMDRLHTALEKDINPTVLQQSRSDVEVLSGDTHKVLHQLSSDLGQAPSSSSPTSGRAPIATSRRRIKIIK